MTARRTLLASAVATAMLGLGACATVSEQGTLAELRSVPPDVDEVYLDDGLELAAESYRRYLEETPESALTPEAMRRLADLQVEQEYGVLGSGAIVEMAAPEPGAVSDPTADASTAAATAMAAPASARPAIAAGAVSSGAAAAPAQSAESQSAFEARATGSEVLLAADGTMLPGIPGGEAPSGPREAIATYQKILANYPDYERNDQVLYQMSRAYDEIGQPDEAMAVMNRLVAEYSHSKLVDEVHFRRGEYYFVRKSYLDAEAAYGSIVDMGSASFYYELALYKLGWTMYKQELYEEALDNYIAMLDHRESVGYDFDQALEESDEHRVADTFRVISLSFSNLGGPEVVDAYFSERGQRSYADKIYGNLAEFYFTKLRYEDAASVYKSFVSLNPFHKVSPRFSMRVIEIYGEAGFPQLVVEAKKQFVTLYASDGAYWQYFDIAQSPDVMQMLKANLTDLANHYHALYQEDELVEERPQSFAEARRWYEQYLRTFPADAETPQVNYQLADLLLENQNFNDAALAYEQTAYGYLPHEQAADAGYAAVYAYREELALATGSRQLEVKQAVVASSLRFADTFREHPEAAVVLGAAADDLYQMQEFMPAIEAARTLIARYPGADPGLLRSAWAVVAYSSMDIAEYADAEFAYSNVLALTAPGDEARGAVVDGLAAAIYKQGEQAILLADYRLAADHFLRIKEAAPDSAIRSAAEYDAAAALMQLEDWSAASAVLEEFRTSHPDHELSTDATKQLAHVYREAGDIERSALEHERIAREATDPEIAREALLTAGELYDEVAVVAEAIRVYGAYVEQYPRPLVLALETRTRLAELHKSRSDYNAYYAELQTIVAADRDAGGERSDRSGYLAAKAALVLAEASYERFASLPLTLPFEASLAEKQRRMDETLAALEGLVAYEVAEVTAAATYYIAETYFNFSAALVKSERPADLSAAELADYELVIEEEAYPFEEQAISVHERNFELLAAGVYNPWVQQSLDRLALLMPGRYAKNEISDGYVGSITTYAYRMPSAPPPVEGDAQHAQADAPENAREEAWETTTVRDFE